MRISLLAVSAALLATSTFAVEAGAFGSERVVVNQHFRHDVGTCHDDITVRGSYQADAPTASGVPIRDAIVDVQTSLSCPGEPVLASSRQIYFAATTQAELFAHMADAASTQHTSRRGEVCRYVPTIERIGDTVAITNVNTACTPPVVALASARRRRR